MLSGGTLPHLLSVANFGSHPGDNFRALREFRQNEPLMCGEFWSGWFDHWYEQHHVRSTEDIVKDTQELFECGASFNYYMFHGGTNFGFWNGANHTGTQYQPTITSYDYCAPLSECGDLTPTYFAIRQLIEDQTGTPAPALDVANLPKTAYGTVSLTESAPLWDNLDNLAPAIHSAAPKTMEELGQDFGYILYSTTLRGPFEPLDLVLEHVHDRALVFLDGKFVGLRERSRTMDEIKLSLGVNETARLDILVENMGRVNYGPKLFDRKGVVGGIRLGQRYHFGWEIRCLTMDDLSRLNWQSLVHTKQPQFLRGTFRVDTPTDTFLKLEGFTKGFCVLNGFNLGRYFNPAGPQKTLFVPGPLLKSGDNELIVFESDAYQVPTVEFLDTPELG